MKIKRVLKFYFYCDRLESAINGIILRRAFSSRSRAGEDAAEDMLEIISDKGELCRLYAYVDGIIKKLPESDVKTLYAYCSLRCGVNALPLAERRAVKRAAVKFVRSAHSIDRYSGAVAILGKYYALIGAG